MHFRLTGSWLNPVTLMSMRIESIILKNQTHISAHVPLLLAFYYKIHSYSHPLAPSLRGSAVRKDIRLLRFVCSNGRDSEYSNRACGVLRCEAHGASEVDRDSSGSTQSAMERDAKSDPKGMSQGAQQESKGISSTRDPTRHLKTGPKGNQREAPRGRYRRGPNRP